MIGYYRDETANKAIKGVTITKTDCFAYKKGNNFGTSYELCDALDRLYCRKARCKFYKNKKEYVVERNDM